MDLDAHHQDAGEHPTKFGRIMNGPRVKQYLLTARREEKFHSAFAIVTLSRVA